jgi:hypothetical protein
VRAQARHRCGRVAVLAAAIVWLTAGAGRAAAQDTTGMGSVAGTLRDAAGQVLAATPVCLQGTTSCSDTDGAGRFRFADVRGGTYRLEILPPGRLPVVSDPIDVRPGVESSIELVVPQENGVSQSVTVSAPELSMPPAVKTSAYLVSTASLLKSAAALQDVSRYVQSLPGVVIGTNDFRNDIIVRGGSPLENLFVVDNVEIPNINTFANFASAGGTVSILDAQLLQDVTFLTGGYPAPYGNRTSSVLQVTQREGSRDEFRGWATLGFAGAGAIAEGPIASDKGSWVVSARRSFLDLFTDDVGIGGVPVLYTLNAKAVYDLSPRDRVWAVNVSAVDDIRLGLNDDTELDDALANFDIRYEGARSATGFNWQRLLGTRGVGLLGVTHSEARVRQQVKDLVRDSVPPPDVPPEALIETSPIVYAEDSREGETTVKYDLTLHLPGVDTVQAGASVKTSGLRYDVDSPYGNDTPYSPEPGVDPLQLSSTFRAFQASAYAQFTANLAPRVALTAGGRFDHYDVLGQSRFSPRVGASVALSDELSWRFSAGQYYQAPAFLFVSSFPEHRALLPWRADHLVTGLVWSPSPGLRLSAEAYRKTYRDYPVAAELPSVSLANIGDTFDVREILFRLTSAGEGVAEGVELFAEQRLTRRLYGQANVSFSRTRHAGLDGVRRPGSFDYPFVFNVTGGYRMSDTWEASARAAFLSGRPYTPYDETVSETQRRGVYDLSRVNALRAPDYVRLDLRADRRFTVGNQVVNVFFGVQNVTNRRNVAGYQWNRRTNGVQVSQQQGVFPILGFDWRF